MPERRDMLHLIAAHLEPFEPVTGPLGPFGVPARTRLTVHPVCFQIASYRGVRGHPLRGVGPGRTQVVEVQLRGPAGMLPILLHQRLDQRRRHGGEMAVWAAPVAQCRDRVGGRAGRVVPALQRRYPEADRGPLHRVAPVALGQRGQRRLQCARLRRCGEQRTNDREAQPRPAIAVSRIVTCGQKPSPSACGTGGTATEGRL